MPKQKAGQHGTKRSVSLDQRRLQRASVPVITDFVRLPQDTVLSEDDESTPFTPNLAQRQVSEPIARRNRVIPTDTMASAASTSGISAVKSKTATFFGVNEENDDKKQQQWNERHLRLLRRKGGKIKKDLSITTSIQTGGATMLRSMGVEDVPDGMESIGSMPPDYDSEAELTSVSMEPVYKLTFSALGHVAETLRKWPKARKEGPAKVGDVSQEVEEDDVFDGEDTFFCHPPSHADSIDGHRRPPRTSSSSMRTPSYATSLKEEMAGRDALTWNVKNKKDYSSAISHTMIETIVDNSVRRTYGMGYVWKLLDTKFKKNLTKEQREALDNLDDSRPYFTYWVTTVQILIMIITLATYGFGHFGFTHSQVTGKVMVSSLSLQQVDFIEPDNFWLGPRAADLIHLGAKFTPCMRKDKHVYDKILQEREAEKATACCIRNDESGCVQTPKEKCSQLLSRWVSWNATSSGPEMKKPYKHTYRSERRTSGTVCGQDPRYCQTPPSVFPGEWPDDITEWPICHKSVRRQKMPASEDHMTCEIIARPCCIGIYGECRIATQEYCDFVKGTFHEEASLCSQVSCMKDICGMIGFYSKDSPDQVYRLWTSLFLHAGLIHLTCTVVYQFFIMRDLEKTFGTVRIMLIYLISGLVGNLASANFVPYRGEVGPAGAQFGVLSCIFIELYTHWDLLENPGQQLAKFSSFALLLFALGLLPWVDNYAHIGGFITGLALSFALLPYLLLKDYKRTKKMLVIASAFGFVLVIIISLLVVLYIYPIYECEWCKYLNCLPLTDNWCTNQDIQIKRIDKL